MAPIRSALGLLTVLVGCSASAPAEPADLPIGGFRAAITRQNLATIRDEMPGGLLEPGWLPAGFVLVHAEYIESGGAIKSADLIFDGGDHYLHIWQTHASAAELGNEDPVADGEQIEGTVWDANELQTSQPGQPAIIEYSTRLADGRTVTVDSDLDDDTMGRVLRALALRDD